MYPVTNFVVKFMEFLDHGHYFNYDLYQSLFNCFIKTPFLFFTTILTSFQYQILFFFFLDRFSNIIVSS